MKNKAFAVIVCLVLVVVMAIPGTLATSTDTDSSQTNTTAEVPATPETPSETPAETPTPNEQPTEGTPEQSEQPAEETPAPSETPKQCTCNAAEGEAHKEGCPLYTAPAESEKPAESTHIDGCSDDCTDESCQCVCHLFNKIMACRTQDELESLIAKTPKEYFELFSEEQIQKIESHIKSLETIPLPPLTLENNIDDGTVASEVVYPTVNYTYVAPFGEPVTGGHR